MNQPLPHEEGYLANAKASDAEECLLGLILQETRLPVEVHTVLQPQDFQHQEHQAIYRAMLDLMAQGQPLDPLNIEAEIKRSECLPKEASGNVFGMMMRMIELPNPAISLAEYLRRIQNRSQARQALAKLPALEEALCASDMDTAAQVLSEMRLSVSASPASALDRPQLPDAALHGLAGEFVRLIEPHTESDPAAILAQFLCAFGNIIGRTAYAPVEASKHYMNLFLVIVGQSAKARKGTSWGHVRRLMEFRERDYADKRIVSGLVSAEGLIYHVRDALKKQKPGGDEGELMTVDEGVRDKRLLVVESEFASVLSMGERDGNTLSACLRDAWDKGNLNTLAKNSPVRATDAHISIIGHITQEELRRKLSETESANGFANRFLWVYARRTKNLPEGGQVPDAEYQQIAEKVGRAVTFAWGAESMKRDEVAREIWASLYERLTRDVPGLMGTVTSRAESQVLRLSCIYALLDCSPVVTPVHLRAAAAFWEYCEKSAGFIFGDALGDRTADTILSRLRTASEGLTRTDILNIFKNNKSAAQIQEALDKLRQMNKAVCITETASGAKKPTERWKAVQSR